MDKYLLKYMMFCFIAMLLNGCDDSESDLLAPKVYFENKEYLLEVLDGQELLTYDLQSRVSALCASSVEVSYEIADAATIEAYNRKNGTDYEAFNTSKVILEKEVVTIPGGNVYAEKILVKLSGLDQVKEGKPYLLPLRIKSSSLPIIEGLDIIYLIVAKPVRIKKVAKFWSNYVKIPLVPGSLFTSVTYEALIHIDRFGSNNTIMGTEGILIFRIGDAALPDKHNDWIQIAGNKQYHSTQTFETGKWYHVAFTYDQPSGKTAIFINGNKATETFWDTPNFDLSTASGGFFIGKVAGFMWGERPFYGRMSEVRLWNVSRTENQIKQNMITVDPKSEGLAAYYKLNGTDQFQDGDTWKVKDASGHGMDGLVNGGRSALNIIDLDEPVTIK